MLQFTHHAVTHPSIWVAATLHPSRHHNHSCTHEFIHQSMDLPIHHSSMLPSIQPPTHPPTHHPSFHLPMLPSTHPPTCFIRPFLPSSHPCYLEKFRNSKHSCLSAFSLKDGWMDTLRYPSGAPALLSGALPDYPSLSPLYCFISSGPHILCANLPLSPENKAGAE